MGIRFSKSIKLGKYLRLNISKSGISATVGKKGATVNIGGKGTYVNVSPSAVGISGTGLSYRQKVTGGYKQLFSKIFKKSDEDVKQEAAVASQAVETNEDLSVVEEYERKLVANTFPYRFIDNVLTKPAFDAKVNEAQSAAAKMVYQLAIDGDEDTIESMVGSFLSSLEFDLPVSASYELEGHDLYVDLDLPEIEDLATEYPTESKGKVVYKKKTANNLKEEYANTAMGLGIYLAGCFFNVSSYIDRIILSGFTTRRNNKGDLNDDYLYSVKFTRTGFEKTDLAQLDDPYKFILGFENRINFSGTTFKAIEPYEMETSAPAETVNVEATNPMVVDAINGLVELGYNAADLDLLVPELNKLELASSGEYLKAALKMMA